MVTSSRSEGKFRPSLSNLSKLKRTAKKDSEAAFRQDRRLDDEVLKLEERVKSAWDRALAINPNADLREFLWKALYGRSVSESVLRRLRRWAKERQART